MNFLHQLQLLIRALLYQIAEELLGFHLLFVAAFMKLSG
jgi:hypothetical protein